MSRHKNEIIQPYAIYPTVRNKYSILFVDLNGTDRVYLDSHTTETYALLQIGGDYLLQNLKCQQMSFAQDLAFVTMLVSCKPLQYQVTIVNKVNACSVLLDLLAQMESLALHVPSRPRQALDLAAV